jgi:hypothetical protein
MAIYRSRMILNQPGKKEFSFLSRGSMGIVKKVVELEAYPGTTIFNVLLVDEINGVRQDDTNLTGNNDALKVVNTIVRIIEKFFEMFPNASLFINGNTAIKKLMYERKIYQMDPGKYMVLGNRQEGQPMKPIERPVNSKPPYNAFLVFLQ